MHIYFAQNISYICNAMQTVWKQARGLTRAYHFLLIKNKDIITDIITLIILA